MEYNALRALQLLRAGTSDSEARFRDGQEAAIRYLVEGRGRLLVVQRTGWGKSNVYFIATKLLREAGLGMALLISPLIALMRDQVSAAKRMGVSAKAIHSGNEKEWPKIIAEVQLGRVDILLITPERLNNPGFSQQVLAPLGSALSLLVIDEAHCISDWGHDFRPEYRLIERTIKNLPANLRVLATTATANDRVTSDLVSVLGPHLHVSRGKLERDSLTLQTIVLSDPAERLAWLAANLARLPGSGIIYTLTIRDATQVTAWLTARGYAVAAYTSESGEDRERLESALKRNQVKALVATMALGMGYDKPDLAFVIHYQSPGSVVGYYQQVGRAGRSISDAYGVILSGREETEIGEWFIKSAFPKRSEVEAVLMALHGSENGLTQSELELRVNLKKGRLEQVVKLLTLESPAPIVRDDKRWRLTSIPVHQAFWDRAERQADLRRAELAEMQAYTKLPFGAHMKFLVAALDGDTQDISPPRLKPLPEECEPELVREAEGFFRRSALKIEPRMRWPEAARLMHGGKTAIPKGHQFQPGWALCFWKDPGWGKLVADGKYVHGRFSDDLVAACVSLYRDVHPDPAPQWVTCIPSTRHPNLVPDFALRLATALMLPFRPVLVKSLDRPEQKSMENSAHQALNVIGSLAISEGANLMGPVLLVDDMVDSRWTLTVAAWLLLSHGCGPVYPLALAQTGHDD